MEDLLVPKSCKYCQEFLIPCSAEGLACSVCSENVHIKCLLRGSVPGGLEGDVFFNFTCQECSDTGSEKFVREKLSWLQAITLTLYHLSTRSPGLARNRFFHWRDHIVSFIDRNWDLLFPLEKKQRKKWMGTVSGRLSHYSNFVFVSGSKTALNKPAWWALMYPRLTPYVISNVYNALTIEKQKAKLKNEKKLVSDAEFFRSLLAQYILDESLIQTVDLSIKPEENEKALWEEEPEKKKPRIGTKKVLPPNFKKTSKKLMKLTPTLPLSLSEEPSLSSSDNNEPPEPRSKPVETLKPKEPTRLLDPMCYFNTSLSKEIQRHFQYGRYPCPCGHKNKHIDHSLCDFTMIDKVCSRIDCDRVCKILCPQGLKLMAQIQVLANKHDSDYVLPPRAPLDYTYVQPEHIPAINSLCNQFFWPGIDLTDSLQYPDFSCVVLYKRLIVGFAFLVPDVKYTENYISFLFTRPGWRNCGIGKFMLYHLIQTSLGKDVTLHVSINNPALFLYQKFGFKVENVILDFYDKYFRSDVYESKHAFFCRLER